MTSPLDDPDFIASVQREQGKHMLATEASEYYYRVWILTGIAANIGTLDVERGLETLAMFQPLLDAMGSQLSSDVEKFQREHGEI